MPPQPKQWHVWLPTGRSLCDRRERPTDGNGTNGDPASTTYTVCAPCAIAVYLLRGQLSGLVRDHGQPEPDHLTAAAQLFDEAPRWAAWLKDRESFLEWSETAFRAS